MIIVFTLTIISLNSCVNPTTYKYGDFLYKNAAQARIKIIKYEGKGGDVVIPAKILGYENIIDKGAFQNYDTITSIKLPDTVITIDDYAFQNCTGLKSVTFVPSGRSDVGPCNIGNYAFQNCTALTNFHFPDFVTSLGDGAFSGCSGLHAAYFEGDAPSEYQMGKDVFAGTASDFTIYYNADKSGWSDGWNGYHAVPLPATTTPSTKPNLV